MPTVVSNATKFMVMVCEEDYTYNIYDDEQYWPNAHKILLDAMNPDESKCWYEHWIVDKGDDARAHPAVGAHESLGRQWREM